MYRNYYSKNRKVRNATVCRADGIEFKSKLEMFCYLWFKSEGITLLYEGEKQEVYEDFVLPENVKVWVGRTKANSKERYMGRSYKFQNVTYSPDFTLSAGEDIFYIETKGNPNDVYPYKKKMFLKTLCNQAAELGCRFYFFEPHSKTEVQQTCEIIKSILNDGRE